MRGLETVLGNPFSQRLGWALLAFLGRARSSRRSSPAPVSPCAARKRPFAMPPDAEPAPASAS